MKKIILLLLLVLPVVISTVVFAVAYTVGRTVMYVEITDVIYQGQGNPLAPYTEVTGGYRITANVGEQKEFSQYFKVIGSSNARFSHLEFEISNKGAVKVENGRIHVMQNLRDSDSLNDDFVEIDVTYGTKGVFLTIFVGINNTGRQNRFDEFDINYRLLNNALQSGYGSDFAEVRFASVNNPDRLQISFIDATEIIDIRRLLHGGIDTSPAGLKNTANTWASDFRDNLTFQISDEGVLKKETDGWSATARIISTGNITVSLTSSFAGKPPITAEVEIWIV